MKNTLRCFMLLVYILATNALPPGIPCIKKQFNNGHACVCNETYCDTYDTEYHTVLFNNVNVYTSTEKGLPLDFTISGLRKTPGSNVDSTITIDSTTKYQTIWGTGAAMTDATVLSLNQLSKGLRLKVLEAAFSRTGAELELMRLPIGSTDFSDRDYSYADGEADPGLSRWALAPEDYYKIGYVHDSEKIASRKIKYLASPWVPPHWMKTDNNTIQQQYYKSWAEYQIKFLKTYEEQGIPMTAVTTGNEPLLAVYSVAWTFPEHEVYLKEYLAPLLREFYPDLEVFLPDDQSPFLTKWETVLSDPELNKAVTGFATHWYLDGAVPAYYYPTPEETFEVCKTRKCMATEACYCYNFPGFNESTTWENGMGYLNSIIERVGKYNYVAWFDWNLLLNEQGGPNWLQNFCDSPIRLGVRRDEFYRQPSHYALMHFSKFVPGGSVRVQMDISTPENVPDLQGVAFLNGGKLVSVLQNKSAKEYLVSLCSSEKRCAQIKIPENSMVTAVTSSETSRGNRTE